MAKGNGRTCVFDRHDSRNACDTEHITFGGSAFLDGLQNRLADFDDATGNGGAVRFLFAADIHHDGLPLFVKMGKSICIHFNHVPLLVAKYIVAVMSAKKNYHCPVGGKEYKFVLANIIYINIYVFR
jgi:hypothetical protein